MEICETVNEYGNEMSVNMLFPRVNEYKMESENADLSKTAAELIENASDPKFANSKVIF